MNRIEYPEEMGRLVEQLKKLPGIGSRSAGRIAVALLSGRKGVALDLSKALEAAALGVSTCARCGFFQSKSRPCGLCHAPGRDTHVVCVVEQPTDVIPLERTGAYRGEYHVLGGRLAPLDNIHPDDLRIGPLLHRIAEGSIREVILAVGSDVEGDATAHYLTEQLSRCEGLKVTRLAQGLPAGGGLEHADDLTLHRALSGRRPV